MIPDTQLSSDPHSADKEGFINSGSDFEAKIRKLLPSSYSGDDSVAPSQSGNANFKGIQEM